MSIEQTLQTRSESKCELCGSKESLSVYEVGPESDGSPELSAYLCQICQDQIEDNQKADANHWRCLNDSMWSEVSAVQVLAFRMLTHLSTQGWARDLLDMLYLEDDVKAWAQAGIETVDPDAVKHIDSNGTQLTAGDTVTLIKDLNVKGGGFTAKRGEMVRGISLVADNAEHIEGKVSGQHIVILTKFVRKMN